MRKGAENELGSIELSIDRLRKIIAEKDEEIERLESLVESLEEKWREHVCEASE